MNRLDGRRGDRRQDAIRQRRGSRGRNLVRCRKPGGNLQAMQKLAWVGTDVPLPFGRSPHELLQEMGERGYLDETVTGHLNHLWGDTPWMYQPPPDSERPVRHNLDTPLLEQLVAEVGGAAVEEVVVHSPFYDRQCEALRRLLTTLAPKRIVVLVQNTTLPSIPTRSRRSLPPIPAPHECWKPQRLSRRPSCTPNSFSSANVAAPCSSRGHPTCPSQRFAAPTRMATSNLPTSLPGLPTRSTPSSTASSSAPKAVDPTTLELRYKSDDTPDPEGIRLVRGGWDGTALTLDASAELPQADAIRLLIAGDEHDADAITVIGAHVSMRPGPVATELLERSFPVALGLGLDGGDVDLAHLAVPPRPTANPHQWPT